MQRLPTTSEVPWLVSQPGLALKVPNQARKSACSSCGDPVWQHLASQVSRADCPAELVDTGWMQLVP